MTNYGSNIKFAEAKNNWIATANIQYNDTVFLNTHKYWRRREESVIKKLIEVIPHETIHSLLWCEGLDWENTYDIVRNKILNDKKLSPYIKSIYYCNC